MSKTKSKNYRKPINNFAINVELSEEQKQAFNIIDKNEITILTGHAGCSKTFIASYYAIYKYYRKAMFNRILISKPVVSDKNEDLGFLPGELEDKMQPWLIPILENLEKIKSKQHVKEMQEKEILEFLPFQHILGRTFVDDLVIVDEIQEATVEQIKMILTRIGEGSKIILTGDANQRRLTKRNNGLEQLIELSNKIDGVGHFELLENRRSPIVQKIIKYYAC